MPIPPKREGVAMLSQREKEVLEHLILGRTNREIGRLLHVSPRTVEIHHGHIFEKMQVRNAVELTRKVLTKEGA